MRAYRLIVWGRELFSWEVDGALEVHVTTEEAEEEDEDDPDGITGGSGGLFERDVNPPDPMGEEPWYEDKTFGFGRG